MSGQIVVHTAHRTSIRPTAGRPAAAALSVFHVSSMSMSTNSLQAQHLLPLRVAQVLRQEWPLLPAEYDVWLGQGIELGLLASHLRGRGAHGFLVAFLAGGAQQGTPFGARCGVASGKGCCGGATTLLLGGTHCWPAT